METQRLRKAPNIAIVGSTSLLGKELREMLEARGRPLGRLALLETEEYAGLLQEFAGEIQITQVISPDVFADIDIVFFTCSPEIMRSYAASGASFPELTIDLTQTGRDGVLYLHEISDPRLLRTKGYFVNPHPAAIVISRVLSDLHNAFTVQSSSVTVLEPASERGNAGVDELQEQTVSLLNFQQVESKVFSGQLAFNILRESDTDRSTPPEMLIQEQLIDLLGRTFPQPMINAAQAPVFHSHVFSMFVRLLDSPSRGDLIAHLARNARFSVDASGAALSPVGVVGTDKIHIGFGAGTPAADGYALWIVTDNLRIAAASAIQTAEHIMFAPAFET
jgi:aspartate-semialdehyde dehydrogenase